MPKDYPQMSKRGGKSSKKGSGMPTAGPVHHEFDQPMDATYEGGNMEGSMSSHDYYRPMDSYNPKDYQG